MIPLFRLFCCIALFCAIASATWAQSPEPTPEAIQFFELKVRPVLANNCFKCHGSEKQKAELRVDTLGHLLAGGESGAAIVPGAPQESRLVAAISYEREPKMPPDGKLKSEEIEAITEWVRMGAPWPGGAAEPVVAKRQTDQIGDEDRSFWSFQPTARPAIPEVGAKDWVANPIDVFVLQKLEAKGITPSAPASRRELIRRAYFDLIGLPPAPQDVEAFEADSAPDAFEKVIDRLLAMPQYGERWGRHWLDLVRFAQSNGYERDDEKPHAWRYRDYVIRSFNEDKPYDTFIREQLAGDEMDERTHEALFATGFYRLGAWDDEPDDKEAAIYDELDDIVRTTTETFLGLTVGCARCHDHKFDPITAADYYKFLAFFGNIHPYANTDVIFQPLAPIDQVNEWRQKRERLEAQVKDLEGKVAALLDGARQRIRQERLNAAGEALRIALSVEDPKRTPEQKQLVEQANSDGTLAEPTPQEIDKGLAPAEVEERKRLDEELRQTRDAMKPPFEQTLAVTEKGTQPGPTHVLVRGDVRSKKEQVEPGFLTVLDRVAPAPPGAPVPQPDRNTSGRRRYLAEWVASRQNPLTARVMANRLWHYHFGRGIVSTPSDFGSTGVPPSHPELLDWLASELMDGGWRLKRMHKLIMLSATYRQSSRTADELARSVDPENTLLWRQNLRRLEAEAIRDSVLAVSGRLNPAMGGRGIFPSLSAEVLSTQSRPGAGWDASSPEEQNRRSVYIFVKRTLGVPILESFDLPTPDIPGPVRSVTTIAPQALILLNSEFVHQQAAALAERVEKEAGESDRRAQIEQVFRLALARKPTDNEAATALQFMARQQDEWKLVSAGDGASGETEKAAGRQALTALCALVLNLNEFVYVD